MKKMGQVAVLLLCGMLAACASNPLLKSDKGIPAHDDKIATDAVAQLMRLYPPAKTQFLLEQSLEGFSALLAQKLRAKGYAVSESHLPRTGLGAVFTGDTFGSVYSPKPVIAPTAPAVKAGAGIPLRYALAHSTTGDFSRVTLRIGNSLLARAYMAVDGRLAPAGAWTYRE